MYWGIVLFVKGGRRWAAVRQCAGTGDAGLDDGRRTGCFGLPIVAAPVLASAGIVKNLFKK
jgi:hypothetical protein